MIGSLISSIPSSAAPSSGTIKNPHKTVLSLCLNFTGNIPSCSISDQLHVFNMIELFLWSVTQVLLTLEKAFG